MPSSSVVQRTTSRLRSSARQRGVQIVDPLRTVDRAVYVTGSARSGTTWIAERFAERHTSRLVFEPLHHRSRLGRSGGVPHLESGPGNDELRSFVRSALDGSCRDPWVNTFQHAAFVTRRVVKDIRPGLLPVVQSVAPSVPKVLVVRDPIDTARSRARLEVGRNWFGTRGALAELRLHAERRDRLGELCRWSVDVLDGPLGESWLTPLVVLWCVENSLAIDVAAVAPTITVIRYEELVRDPVTSLRSVAAAVGIPTSSLGEVGAPSSTAFRTGGVQESTPTSGRSDEDTESELRRAVATWLPQFAGRVPDDGV